MRTAQSILTGQGGLAGRAIFQPGQSFPKHFHHKVTEVFICTSGLLTVSIGETEYRLKPGEVAIAPPGIHHQTSNTSLEAVEFFYVKTPPNPDDCIWVDESETKS